MNFNYTLFYNATATTSNTCFMKPKKFLKIFTVHGTHNVVINRIKRFTYSSTDFVVSGYCIKCKEKFERHFVTQKELLNLGFDSDFLFNINEWGKWFDENEFPNIGV
jgi:alpha-L-arabinofuranosidase